MVSDNILFRRSILALPMCLMIGCSVITGDRGASKVASSGDAQLIYDTQVTVSPCVTIQPNEAAAIFGTLLSALISTGVSTGVDWIGNVLENAAGPETKTVLVSRNVEMNIDAFQMNTCVQVARGWFYPSGAGVEPNEASWNSDAEKLTHIVGIGLFNNGLRLAAAPDFFAEGVIASTEHSPGKGHAMVVPLYGWLDQPISSGNFPFGSGQSSRWVTVGVGIDKPGTTTVSESGGGALMVLGELEFGQERSYSKGGAVDVESDLGSTIFVYPPNASDWFSLVGFSKTYEPRTVRALVSETRMEDAFFGFLAKVFSAAKEDITEQATALLDPELRAKAEETAKDDEDTKNAAVETAVVTALGAFQSCDDLSSAQTDADRITAVFGYRQAVRTLNNAFRDAGKPELIGASIVENLESNELETVKSGCNRVLQQLLKFSPV